MKACARKIRSALHRAPDRVIDHENQDCTQHGHHQAVDVQTSDTVSPEKAEKPTAHHGADDSQDDVEEKAFAALVDDFASDEPGN